MRQKMWTVHFLPSHPDTSPFLGLVCSELWLLPLQSMNYEFHTVYCWWQHHVLINQCILIRNSWSSVDAFICQATVPHTSNLTASITEGDIIAWIVDKILYIFFFPTARMENRNCKSLPPLLFLMKKCWKEMRERHSPSVIILAVPPLTQVKKHSAFVLVNPMLASCFLYGPLSFILMIHCSKEIRIQKDLQSCTLLSCCLRDETQNMSISSEKMPLSNDWFNINYHSCMLVFTWNWRLIHTN